MMPTLKLIFISTTASVAMLLTNPSFAQSFFNNSLPINRNATLKVGANVSFNQYAYDQDHEITVTPQAFYDNNRVYIEGAEAGVYAYKDAKNEWRATLGYDSRHFDPANSENTQLKGMNERDWSVMVGSSYMRITPYGGFKAHAETDLLGRHDGTTVKLAHLSRFKFADDKLTIYPEVGVQWNNGDYNQYYYGVSADESHRTLVTAYQVDSSVNPYVNVSASYAFHPKISGFVSQSLAFLSSEQKNSPLVNDDVESKTKIGFNYQF